MLKFYPLIFRMMYGIGLRIGEISHRCYKDVDRERQMLVIRDTKFGKSRLVPFGSKMGDGRCEMHPTEITSQLPVSHWHEVIEEPTVADAILDRLVHNAYKINLKKDSMRKKKRKLT